MPVAEEEYHAMKQELKRKNMMIQSMTNKMAKIDAERNQFMERLLAVKYLLDICCRDIDPPAQASHLAAVAASAATHVGPGHSVPLSPFFHLLRAAALLPAAPTAAAAPVGGGLSSLSSSPRSGFPEENAGLGSVDDDNEGDKEEDSFEEEEDEEQDEALTRHAHIPGCSASEAADALVDESIQCAFQETGVRYEDLVELEDSSVDEEKVPADTAGI